MLRTAPWLAWFACVAISFTSLPVSAAAGTNSAALHLYCLSVRVEPGTGKLFGLSYSLEFTSGSFASPNHELFPTLEDDFTHLTLFRLDGTDFPEPISGQLALNVPEDLDANTNGVPDFYEVATAIPTTTRDGAWESDVTGGDLQVTWQRDAANPRGTCKIKLRSADFGDLPEFTHAFEIIEYDGALRYVPGPDPIRAALALHRVGATNETLAGPLVLERQPTNHLHQFTIGESTLTNHLGAPVPVSLGDVESDPDYTMSYFGAVALLNGDPATPEVDYELFYIGVEDTNDADLDGIPDLTDDPATPPTPASLALVREGAEFRLQLRGDPGIAYRLERTSRLNQEAWVTDRTLTLTNATHTLQLPAFDPALGFWRLARP